MWIKGGSRFEVSYAGRKHTQSVYLALISSAIHLLLFKFETITKLQGKINIHVNLM